MFKVFLYLSLAVSALVLIGCQGTSNSSASSTGTCTYNASTGYYTNSSTGAICSSSVGTAGCTYNASTGTYYNSTTGALCSTTSTGSCILTAQGYYINSTTGAICSTTTAYTGTSYGSTGTSGSCTSWYYVYGVMYYPAYVNGVLMCVASY